MDNRKVTRGIGAMEGEKWKALTDADKIASSFSQAELDGFVKSGVLEGDWTSSKVEEKPEANEAEGAKPTTKSAKK